MADFETITAKDVKSGIYSITNERTGRVYVGSSQNIYKRWKGHRHQLRKGNHHSRRMQFAWNKDGEDSFVFSVLETVPNTDLLYGREQHWIAALEAFSQHKGYNMYPTPYGARGIKLSPEMRAKLSLARTGKKRGPHSVEHKAALSRARMGHVPSVETRAKLSAAHKGKKKGPHSADHRAALSRAKMGYVHSVQAKTKMSVARTGRKKSEAASATNRAVLLLRNQSEALRQKNKERMLGTKGWCHGPEARAKMSEAGRGKKKSPQHLEAIRLARLRASAARDFSPFQLEIPL